jgi:hypothetical protein
VRAGNADHGDILWSDWSETRSFNVEPLNTDCGEDDEDNDGDGYTENQNDCNDGDASIHPNADEVCDDGIDQNCNNTIDEGCNEPPPSEILSPELLYPRENTLMDNGCDSANDPIQWDFRWSQVEGANQYEIEILDGQDELVISQTTEAYEFSFECSDNSNEFPGCVIYASDYRNWHWRVRAGNADHGDILWNDWSETRSFNVEPLNTDCEESRREDYNIAITGLYPESDATLLTGDEVLINFTYYVPGQENVRIFSHPFTNGNPVPNQKASPSPVYEAGEGQGENSFTISVGDNILVDHVQFTIESLEGQIQWQGFFEVDYEFVDGSEDVGDDTTASENEDDIIIN